MIIGITGKYCAGKTFIVSLFESKGFRHIDVDKIGHQALEHFKNIIISKFGKDIQSDKGEINRKALSIKVFAQKDKLLELETLVHPWMYEQIINILKKNSRNQPHFVLDAALLHHMKLDALCDIVILVKTPLLIRMLRAFKRDKLSAIQIIRRINSQANIPNNLPINQANINNINTRSKLRTIITPNSNNQKKILLNNYEFNSELVISGTYNFVTLEKKFYKLFEELNNGTISTTNTTK